MAKSLLQLLLIWKFDLLPSIVFVLFCCLCRQWQRQRQRQSLCRCWSQQIFVCLIMRVCLQDMLHTCGCLWKRINSNITRDGKYRKIVEKLNYRCCYLSILIRINTSVSYACWCKSIYLALAHTNTNTWTPTVVGGNKLSLPPSLPALPSQLSSSLLSLPRPRHWKRRWRSKR